MSAINDGRLPIELDSKDRYLLFSLNAIDAVQDKYGDFNKISDVLSAGTDQLKNLRWLLTLLLNEGAVYTAMINETPISEAEVLTEDQVGRLIHTGNFINVKTAIFKAFAIGNTGSESPSKSDDDENDDDDADDETDDEEKNAAARGV
jgi:hypothetical protein